MKNQLLLLSYVNHRSYKQTNELYELCGNDFEKLMKVMAELNRTFQHFTPADVETVNELVVEWDNWTSKQK